MTFIGKLAGGLRSARLMRSKLKILFDVAKVMTDTAAVDPAKNHRTSHLMAGLNALEITSARREKSDAFRFTEPFLKVAWRYGNERFRRVPLARRELFVALNVVAMLSTQAAFAQPILAQQKTANELPSFCKKSTLTGDEFLQLIQTIVAHGDLTDIEFLKKILGTEFISHYGSSELGRQDSQIVVLNSQQVLGNPLSVQVTIYYAKSDQVKFGEIADLAFNNPSTFIPVCFHFLPLGLASYFKVAFYREILYGSPVASYYQQHSSSGKNGSKINLGFRYVIKENVVSYIGIGQYP